MPGGSFAFELAQLRRSVRIVPQADVIRILQEAVLAALQDYEEKFWEELFLEEGEANCIYWAKLVGLYDPVIEKLIRALGLRRDGDASAWLTLVGVAPPPPPPPALFNFMNDDMTGHMMWFDDFLE
jgi:hypothetical protein